MAQDKVIWHNAAEKVKGSLIAAARILPPDIENLIASAHPEGGKSRSVMEAIRDNLNVARETGLPMCQDTGAFWCLASIGRDSDASLRDIERIIISGCAMAAEEGFFRRSIVEEPYGERHNTGTNLPPFIYYELCDGNSVELSFLLKGFGSENCSGIRMLNPTAGTNDIVAAVVDMVRSGGGKPCPPIFLGVGIGGTMDRAAFLSKKAFFRESMDKELSSKILEEVNKLGIGPGGLGGYPTALAVSVLSEPTHIAGLPVALTVNCWAERRAVVRFGRGDL